MGQGDERRSIQLNLADRRIGMGADIAPIFYKRLLLDMRAYCAALTMQSESKAMRL